MALEDNQNIIITPYSRRNTPRLDESMKFFIREEFQQIEATLRSVVDACPQVANKEPETPRRGMVRYAVSPWDPLGNSYSGLVVFNGTAWVQV